MEPESIEVSGNQTQGSPNTQPPLGEAASPMDAVRTTPEYKAAWDIEVWKLMQQRKLDKELKDNHKKAVDQMKQSVAQRDKEAQHLIDRKLKEVNEELRKVTAESTAQEQRKRRLVEAERELKRQKSELLESHKKQEAESDEKVQRVKAETLHRLALEAERFKGMESINKRNEERLADQGKEYQKLWQEFSDFKAAQLSGTGAAGVQALHWKGQMETLKAQHASEIVALSERNERRLHESMVAHERKMEDLHRDNRKLSTSITTKREQLKVISQDLMLEKEKSRDLGKELSMVRQQLTETKATVAAASTFSRPLAQQNVNAAAGAKKQKEEATALRESVLRVEATAQGWQQQQDSNRTHQLPPQHQGEGGGGGRVKSASQVEKDLQSNIQRWEKEKAALLENTGGAYSEGSAVIQDLTRRILAARTSIQQLLK